MRRAGLRVPVTETYGNGTIRDGGKTLRMLGWHVSVYRQTDGGASPAAFESPEGTRGTAAIDWNSFWRSDSGCDATSYFYE